jgi:antitoxin component of MazEF toxin-antitoxin module
MPTTIQKWGNSHAVRLPSLLAKKAGFAYGTEVEVEQVKGGVLIKATGKKRKYTLKSLLAQCEGKTPPPEVDWGTPVGREVW